MTFFILQHGFCVLLNYIFFMFLYVLGSKFNWKPVFKLQVNRAFLPTTPKRPLRGVTFLLQVYLAYCHLVISYFTFLLNLN